jgi:hypothetical protein
LDGGALSDQRSAGAGRSKDPLGAPKALKMYPEFA